jgi:hypothetical protein
MRTRRETTSITRSRLPSAWRSSRASHLSDCRMLTPVLGSFAPPGQEKLHGENISLVIKFFLGMHDLFHLPVPIWIAVEFIVGTIRLRCQIE